jgi:hypothetical protein
MSGGTVRKWRWAFKDGQTNVPDEEGSGRPPVGSDAIQNVDHKFSERRQFLISALSYEFLQISRTRLYEIVTVGLGLSQVSRGVGSKST